MDRLLKGLTDICRSLCGLYLGGAAHADDVRAIAPSATAAEQQRQIIHSFASSNGLKLKSEKTEVVKFSQSKCRGQDQLQLAIHSIELVPQAMRLGYLWSNNLTAKPSVELNINNSFSHLSLWEDFLVI